MLTERISRKRPLNSGLFFCAIYPTGALSFADGLRLVRERGRLMQEAGTRTPGMMAAIDRD